MLLAFRFLSLCVRLTCAPAHIRGEAIPTFEEFSADFEKLIANADSENTLEAARPLASVD